MGVPSFGNPRIIMLICSSPRLIAACHVLHRLLMPRHSPYALFRLNFLLYSLFSELLEFLLKQDIVFALKRFFLFVSLSTFRWNCNCLNLLRRYPFWKDSINFSILSSFICSFLTHFHPNFFEFFFTYSIVKFHACSTQAGRSGWTRTIDLALIRRAL